MKWYGVEFSNEVEEGKYADGVVLPKIALFRAILKADGVENEATQCYNNTLLRVYLNEADLRSYNEIIDLVYNVDIVQVVPKASFLAKGFILGVEVYYKEACIFSGYNGYVKTSEAFWNKAVEIVLLLHNSFIQKTVDRRKCNA